MAEDGILHLFRAYLTREYGYGAGAFARQNEETGQLLLDARGAASAALARFYEGGQSNPHFHHYVDAVTEAYNQEHGTRLTPQEYMATAVHPGGPDLVTGYLDWVEGLYSFEHPAAIQTAASMGYTPAVAEDLLYGPGEEAWREPLGNLQELLQMARGSEDGLNSVGAASGLGNAFLESLAALPEHMEIRDGSAVIGRENGPDVVLPTAGFASITQNNEALIREGVTAGLTAAEIGALVSYGDLVEAAAAHLDLPVDYVSQQVTKGGPER